MTKLEKQLAVAEHMIREVKRIAADDAADDAADIAADIAADDARPK